MKLIPALLFLFVAPGQPRMSDTPTFANLLTQWTGGGPAARAEVYAHLRRDPALAAAVEASVRDELSAALPWRRVIAAEAMLEVYRDEAAAAAALGGVLRQDYSSIAGDAIPLLERLSPDRAAPLLVDFAIHAPAVFRAQSSWFHRRAGATAARRGAEMWLPLFAHAGPEAESALLMGLAGAAPRVTHDLSAVEPAVRLRLFHDLSGYAAGAALWRLTWRVNRGWLASINPRDPRLDGDRPLLGFLIEVLAEHLGRRPALAPLVRELLVRLGHEYGDFSDALRRLAHLGARGWAVLLPILGDTGADTRTRALVFGAAARHPAVLPLVHHHAHAAILEGERTHTVPLPELLEAAAGVLRAIGAPAGSALADILNVIVKRPETARVLAPALPALAPGYPTPVAAVARTLDRLRRARPFAPEAFAAVARALAGLSLDAAPGLVEDTSFDLRTPDALLQHTAWKDAPVDIRRGHALALADALASPRPEVRSRAAELLRHYPDQMPAVWPALVALLTGTDEQAVTLVLPYFRHLAAVAGVVAPDLTALFREPNPTYAARAVVALWALGRMPEVADELLASVAAGDAAWGWAVLRGVVDRVFHAPGVLRDLSQVFAAAPEEVAAKVHAMMNPPESAEEAAISTHIRPEAEPRVNWNGVYQCVGNDAEGGLLFLALLCAYGSAGFAAQKVWMIKHQRTLTGCGLGEAKGIVEGVLLRLTPTAAPDDRRTAVRAFFNNATWLPDAITALLGHRLSWYRWAAVELLDAWGAPDETAGLVADRVWDRSALVRTRALRMRRGK